MHSLPDLTVGAVCLPSTAGFRSRPVAAAGARTSELPSLEFWGGALRVL